MLCMFLVVYDLVRYVVYVLSCLLFFGIHLDMYYVIRYILYVLSCALFSKICCVCT